jgi:hypothetical protein
MARGFRTRPPNSTGLRKLRPLKQAARDGQLALSQQDPDAAALREELSRRGKAKAPPSIAHRLPPTLDPPQNNGAEGPAPLTSGELPSTAVRGIQTACLPSGEFLALQSNLPANVVGIAYALPEIHCHHHRLA